MKKRIPTFLAGMLTAALVGSLGVGALAATGALTIEVTPINVQVNGQTFQPKDAKGNSVPVFSYNGTTYAPLRALAEAYGLEVGYDAKANMATVGETAPTTPDTLPADYSKWTAEEEKAYQEFKGMWDVKLTYSKTDDSDPMNNGYEYTAAPNDLGKTIAYWDAKSPDVLEVFVSRLFMEIAAQHPNYGVRLYLEVGTWNTDDYHRFANVIGGENYIHVLNVWGKE